MKDSDWNHPLAKTIEGLKKRKDMTHEELEHEAGHRLSKEGAEGHRYLVLAPRLYYAANPTRLPQDE